jgi:rhodanese-related sulfurtransferase
MKRALFVIVTVGLAALIVGCSPASYDVDDVQRISPAEAKALLDSGQAHLYDTRSADAYQSHHARGAVSLPERELGARIDELPDDGKALIFY